MRHDTSGWLFLTDWVAAAKGAKYTVYDHWIDIPEDSYMYSTAFTECIAARKQNMSEQTPYGKTVRLKVRAPQLRNNERLAIIGEGDTLGDWEAIRAISMVEHENNEWVISLDADKLPNTLEFKFVALDEETDHTPLWENGMNRTVELPKIDDGEVVVYELSQAYFLYILGRAQVQLSLSSRFAARVVLAWATSAT